MNKLSICIPTYNRNKYLLNCLESVYQSKKNTIIKFDVCISGNNSAEDIRSIVQEYKNKHDIKYHKKSSSVRLRKQF